MKDKKKEQLLSLTPDELINYLEEGYSREMGRLNRAISAGVKVVAFMDELMSIRNELTMRVIRTKEGTKEGDDARRVHDRLCRTISALDYGLIDAGMVFNEEELDDDQNDEGSEV